MAVVQTQQVQDAVVSMVAAASSGTRRRGCTGRFATARGSCRDVAAAGRIGLAAASGRVMSDLGDEARLDAEDAGLARVELRCADDADLGDADRVSIDEADDAARFSRDDRDAERRGRENREERLQGKLHVSSSMMGRE
jgi:hypothetical protein